jgi:hypothetical protein
MFARLRHAAAALGEAVRSARPGSAPRAAAGAPDRGGGAGRLWGAGLRLSVGGGADPAGGDLDRIGDAVGTGGAAGWLAEQPFGRVWLVLLGLGLWAFVGWRVLQAVFDADHEGTDLKGWATRAGQAASGLFYGLLAAGVFEYLDEVGEATSQAADQAESIAENQEKAAMILDLPFGGLLLIGAGLVVLGVGIGNIVRAFRDDFDDALACPEAVRRPATALARAGYGARGFAYLPLGVFVVLAGLHARSGEVTTTAAALDALEAQPGGSWILGLTAAGLMAFGAFAFVEARWRRIRPPRDLTLG